MNVLKRLTDPAMKRLYKFFVKKMVGNFLKDDLLLEQLDVQLRAGIIELSNFALDCDALNELASSKSCPVKILSAFVQHLRIHISYTDILSESITIYVEGVNIEVSQCFETTKHKRSNLPSKTSSTNSEAVQSDFPLEGESEGLDLVSSWIEQIANKVKVSVIDFTVKLHTNSSSNNDIQINGSHTDAKNEQKIILHISSADVCDETPIRFSTLPSEKQPIRISPLNVSRKKLTVGPVKLSLENGPVFSRSLGNSSISVMYNSTGERNRAPLIEVDVSIKQLEFRLCPGLVLRLHELMNAFEGCSYENCSTNDSPSDVVNNMLSLYDIGQKNLFKERFWYTESSEFEEKEINLNTLEDLLAKYVAARERIEQGISASAIGDDVFYDAEQSEPEKDFGVLDPSSRITSSPGLKLKFQILDVMAFAYHTSISEITSIQEYQDIGKADHFSFAANHTAFSMYQPGRGQDFDGGNANHYFEVGSICLKQHLYDNSSAKNCNSQILVRFDAASPCVKMQHYSPSSTFEFICKPIEVEIDLNTVNRVNSFLSACRNNEDDGATENSSSLNEKHPSNTRKIDAGAKKIICISIPTIAICFKLEEFGAEKVKATLQRILSMDENLWEVVESLNNDSTVLNIILENIVLTNGNQAFGSNQPMEICRLNCCSVDMALPHPERDGFLMQRQFLYAGKKLETCITLNISSESANDKNVGAYKTKECNYSTLYSAYDDELLESSLRPSSPPLDSSTGTVSRILLKIPLIYTDLSKNELSLIQILIDSLHSKDSTTEQREQSEKSVRAQTGNRIQFAIEVNEISTLLHAYRVDENSNETNCDYTTTFYACLWQCKVVLGDDQDTKFGVSVHDITIAERSKTNSEPDAVLIPVNTIKSVKYGHQTEKMKMIPVLYRTKWSQQTQSPSLSIRCNLTSVASRQTITISFDMNHVTLRYRVESRWLIQLLGIFSAPQSSSESVPVLIENDNIQCKEGSKPKMGGMLKVFVAVHNACVDFCTEDCRGVISVRMLRMSANLIDEAITQGFKMVARDVAFHCFPLSTTYSTENHNIWGVKCIGKLEVQLEDDVKATKLSHSDQEYLERRGFAKVATLDFIDAFIRAKTKPPSATESYALIELWMGLLRVYTCQDSLSATTRLLSEWCRLYQEHYVQPAAIALARASAIKAAQFQDDDGDDCDGKDSKGQRLKVIHTKPLNLLECIDEDVYGSNTNPPKKIMFHESVSLNRPSKLEPAKSTESSNLLIEDYYCLQIQQPESQLQLPKPQTFNTDSNKTLYYEKEAVGTWFNSDAEKSDSESDFQSGRLLVNQMESVHDSDSDVENEGIFLSSVPLTGTANGFGRFNLGMFNLPKPLDIELDDFHRELNEEFEFEDKNGFEVQKAVDISGSIFSSPPDGQLIDCFSNNVFDEDNDKDYGTLSKISDEPSNTDSIYKKDDSSENVSPIHAEPLHQPESAAQWFIDENKSETTENSLKIFPHHIPIPLKDGFNPGLDSKYGINADINMAPKGVNGQNVSASLILHSLNVCWRLFKGNDWDLNPPDALKNVKIETKTSTNNGVIKGSKNDETENKKSNLLDALLENYQDACFIGENKAQGYQHYRTSLNRKLSYRDTSQMVEVSLVTVTLRLQQFHPSSSNCIAEKDSDLVSNMAFAVKDLCIRDTLTSRRLRKMLAHYHSDDRNPRQCHQSMITLQLTARSAGNNATIIYPHSDTDTDPILMGEEYMLKLRLLPLHLTFGQHTVDFLNAFVPPPSLEEKSLPAGPRPDSLFLQNCDIGSFKLAINYIPRLINLRALQDGAYMELLNLFPLEGVNLQVQRVELNGVNGFGAVARACMECWVRDITGSQMHKFLAGTAAVRPLVNVSKGVADLVLVPIRQYKRNGKILCGIRKGTTKCAGRVLAETLDTSYKIARYVSRTLDDISTVESDRGSRIVQCYDVQPRGVYDSLEQAYTSLSREVTSAAHAIIAIPYEEQEELGGYARTVVRALPIAVLRPVVGATEAVSFALLGFRNTVQPSKKKEEESQWL